MDKKAVLDRLAVEWYEADCDSELERVLADAFSLLSSDKDIIWEHFAHMKGAINNGN